MNGTEKDRDAEIHTARNLYCTFINDFQAFRGKSKHATAEKPERPPHCIHRIRNGSVRGSSQVNVKKVREVEDPTENRGFAWCLMC